MNAGMNQYYLLKIYAIHKINILISVAVFPDCDPSSLDKDIHRRADE
jgi:hypothetical protein